MAELIKHDAMKEFPYTDYLRQKQEEGKKLIGIMGHELLPLEILRSFDVHVLPLVFVGPESLSNDGGIFLTHSFCTYSKNVMGAMFQKEIPIYHDIDFLIGTNFCNGDFCGMEYMQKELEIPLLKFTIPFKRNRQGHEFFRDEVIAFKNLLELDLGESIADEKILEQVRIASELRSELKRIHGIGIRGLELLRRYQEATVLAPSDMIERLRYLYGGRDFLEHPNGELPLIFTGDPIFINDVFGRWLEAFGANIVYYDTWIGGMMEDFNIDIDDDDVLGSIAKSYLDQQGNWRMVPGSVRVRVKRLVRLLKDHGARGIINHTLKFCDFQGIDGVDLKDELGEDAHILDIERDYSRSSRGTLQTRVEAFIELLQ
ncbi:hypothetical protein GF325_16155, partial [Candidatus Bathyarchaeota archaeon]|nr:hypothetical protein [Candidatus Bathyarchaeota archaeon]